MTHKVSFAVVYSRWCQVNLFRVKSKPMFSPSLWNLVLLNLVSNLIKLEGRKYNIFSSTVSTLPVWKYFCSVLKYCGKQVKNFLLYVCISSNCILVNNKLNNASAARTEILEDVKNPLLIILNFDIIYFYK